MKNNNCSSCIHYHETGLTTGYCDLILVAIKEYVCIITTPLMLGAIEKKLNPDVVYANPIVHKDFACVLYEILEFPEYIN